MAKRNKRGGIALMAGSVKYGINNGMGKQMAYRNGMRRSAYVYVDNKQTRRHQRHQAAAKAASGVTYQQLAYRQQRGGWRGNIGSSVIK